VDEGEGLRHRNVSKAESIKERAWLLSGAGQRGAEFVQNRRKIGLMGSDRFAVAAILAQRTRDPHRANARTEPEPTQLSRDHLLESVPIAKQPE
jgi:hypothetical protein